MTGNGSEAGPTDERGGEGCWFAASLMYQACHRPPREDGLWEERIVLIRAGSQTQALEQAERLGPVDEVGYATSEGEVQWRFVRVDRVCAIEAEVLGSGTEVFSRFLNTEEAEGLARPLK
ncbi:DUF4288 domain-containing protein [Lysobacter antibioticus]|uniref:DUF4288 domain-containing protein n=1 Tax=Lysobacter antibioticus TaxID=84531 RepID=UPI0003450078|nr:DUF4288 domain-containing protein [Lysobacter antibioticus]